MTEERRDIESRADIECLVDTFYEQIREDDLLGPIFNQRIADRWPEHLDKMYRFWSSILLGESEYHGRPFPPHAIMNLEVQHFERWLGLFNMNAEQFEGPVVEEAKRRAGLMASLFLHKIEHLRKQGNKVIIH